jgi:hypothetical protein
VTPVAASHSANCQEALSSNYQAGEVFRPTALNGIYAIYDANGLPETCTGSDSFSMTSFWVGIQASNGAGIVQVGLVKCKDDGPIGYWQGRDPCESDIDNTWRYFYAFSGCNGNVPWPRDLGPANITVDHTLSVIHNSSVIQFNIDGGVKAQISYGEMSCWDNSNDNAVIACEVKDKGDSCGGFAAAPLRFRGVQYRRAADFDWVIGGMSAPCTTTGQQGRFFCAIYTDHKSMDLWTVQP